MNLRSQFIKSELNENPEFFKAYPHMQTIFAVNEDATNIDERHLYDHKLLTGFQDKTQEVPYFKSLFDQQNKYLATEEAEEIVRENERNFIEGVNSPTGPLKYMSKEQLKLIHQQIDQKMQELEDSGLTRDEILYNKQTGMPLADDPFFQFVKRNKAAREMLIKPNEIFSLERVIEKALRQDVGPDPTLAINKQSYKLEDHNEIAYEVNEYRKKYRDRDPALNPEAYFYDYNMLERRQRQFDFDQEKPATFINRPLSRSQLRKNHMRMLRKKDIDWKNLPLLCKFMNDSGKIMNKYQTRLKASVQRKIARTIKKVRDLNLISHVGVVKPTDKIPVGSFLEDLEEMHKKTIDPVTGRLFLKHSLQDDLPTKEKRVHENIVQRFADIETVDQYAQDQAADIKNKIIREMSIDNEKFIPERKQREWMAVNINNLIKFILDEEEEKARVEGRDYKRPEVQYLGALDAYTESMNKLKAADPNPNNMFDTFLAEKSLDINRLEQIAYSQNNQSVKRRSRAIQSNEDESLIKLFCFQSDQAIRSRIRSILSKYAESGKQKDAVHQNEVPQGYGIRDQAIV